MWADSNHSNHAPYVYAARSEDAALLAFIDIALVLIYTCALLIKSCDMSSVSAAFREVHLIKKKICSACMSPPELERSLRL